MSLAEIKNGVRQLTPDDRKEVARLLLELEQSENTPRRAKDFAEASNYVFDNYGDLLRRLAQ